MTTTILQAAVGAGKTEAALRELLNTLQTPDKPFPKVWVLLATRRQEYDFRRRLVELLPEQAVFFNTDFFNFYELNVQLLNMAGQAPRRINEDARMGLLRLVIRELLTENALSVYTDIALTPGFIRLVADFIYELKQNRVLPEDYLQVAQSADARPKDHDLALIYLRYQTMLQDYHLVDREGEGWLALLALEHDISLASDVDLLLVDGYDQFTPVQAELLSWLSQRVKQVTITLTALSDRKNTIGLRFQRAFDALQQAHQQLELSLDTASIPQSPDRDIDLYTLGANIFRHNMTPVQPQTDAIKLLAAPDAAQEVAAILRDVKALLLDGQRPDDILIAVRDWQSYQPYFEVYSRLYDLPILLHQSASLLDVPVIAVLLKILTLHESFRRVDVLDILRSPYVQLIDIDATQIDLLEQISLVYGVIGGRDAWMQAIKKAAGNSPQDEDYDNTTAPLITDAQESDLSIAVEGFFDFITPPEQGTITAYVTWLEKLIGQDTPEDDDPDYDIRDDYETLHLLTQIRATEDNPALEYLVSRDIEAMQGFKRILRGFLQTELLLQSLFKRDEQVMSWQIFHRDLLAAVNQSGAPQRHPSRTGRILVTTANNARGLPHPHVFIPGLSEGIFPAPTPDDLLYLDGERRALYASGIQVRLPEEQADDDGLFYELISLPRLSLTLSRPTIKNGKEWNPSHLWRMTREIFVEDSLPIKTLKAGQIIAPSAVATSDEAMLAVMHQWRDNQIDSDVRQLAAWLNHRRPDVWQRVRDGYQVEAGRMSRDVPVDEYTGMIHNSDLIVAIQPMMDDNTRWSATRLNNYGSCGYRYFANYILKLDALSDPEDGIDVLQRGEIYHEVLEKTYRAINEDEIDINPENQADAEAILSEIAEDVFMAAPAKYGFPATILWQREQQMMQRRLNALIKLDFSSDCKLNRGGSSRRPWQVEFKFGIDDFPALKIPIGHDDISHIYVRGAIDRIDIYEGSNPKELIVIDYKSGSTGIPTREMEEGRNFQMMIYLLALHQYLQQRGWHSWQVVRGVFWHIRDGKFSGDIKLNVAPGEHDSIKAAQQYVADYILKARAGNFAIQPTALDAGRCSKYCDFYQLCRISNTALSKVQS